MGELIRESHPAGAWVWNCMPPPGASSVQMASLLALSLQTDFQRGLRGDRSHALLAPVRVGIRTRARSLAAGIAPRLAPRAYIVVTDPAWPDIVIGLGVAVLFGSSAVTVLRDSLPSAMMPTALMTSLAGTRPRAMSCATHELRCLDRGAQVAPVRSSRGGGSTFQVQYPTAGGTGLASPLGMAKVAVINSSEDTVEVLRTLLEREGWETVPAHVDDIKRGRTDFLQYLEVHDPQVIIWDVPPPYDHGWAFLQLVRSSRAMDGRVVIVTTTNKQALERFVGPTDAIEIFTKPYDVEVLIDTITRTLKVA